MSQVQKVGRRVQRLECQRTLMFKKADGGEWDWPVGFDGGRNMTPKEKEDFLTHLEQEVRAAVPEDPAKHFKWSDAEWTFVKVDKNPAWTPEEVQTFVTTRDLVANGLSQLRRAGAGVWD